jgi:hypothetical protein
MNPKIIDNPPKMWWSGDKRVEPYMPKINEALERNGLTGDAKTDCYNRAYEAVYKAIIDATAERDRMKSDRDELIDMLKNISYFANGEIQQRISAAINKIQEADK